MSWSVFTSKSVPITLFLIALALRTMPVEAMPSMVPPRKMLPCAQSSEAPAELVPSRIGFGKRQ
ncbi:hypothetical protein D3C72_2549550 [compost metagenome]